MEVYFEKKKRLMPKHTDLSFYNWETQMSTSNPTPNFQVGMNYCARRQTSTKMYDDKKAHGVWLPSHRTRVLMERHTSVSAHYAFVSDAAAGIDCLHPSISGHRGQRGRPTVQEQARPEGH
jgi:hypothetical protein